MNVSVRLKTTQKYIVNYTFDVFQPNRLAGNKLQSPAKKVIIYIFQLILSIKSGLLSIELSLLEYFFDQKGLLFAYLQCQLAY